VWLIPSSIATSLESYMTKYVQLVLKWITDCVIAVRICDESYLRGENSACLQKSCPK